MKQFICFCLHFWVTFWTVGKKTLPKKVCYEVDIGTIVKPPVSWPTVLSLCFMGF